jgi:hypothetical protein
MDEWDIVVLPQFTIEKIPEQEFSLDLLVQSRDSNVQEFEVVNQNEFAFANEQCRPPIEFSFESLTQHAAIDYVSPFFCVPVKDNFVVEDLVQIPKTEATFSPEVKEFYTFDYSVCISIASFA